MYLNVERPFHCIIRAVHASLDEKADGRQKKIRLGVAKDLLVNLYKLSSL
jgi:hypothetical protein